MEAGTVIDQAGDPIHRFVFNVDATEFASAGSNPIVSSVIPALPLCGIVCQCDLVPGATDELYLQFEDGAINLGVGATVIATFGDATTDAAATIEELLPATPLGFQFSNGPVYRILFAADRN